MTPQIALIRRDVEARWGDQIRNLGVTNCRRIARSSSWSQHSWSNAWDIGTPWGTGHRHFTILDQIHSYLDRNRDRYRIKTMLWRVRDHFDHIHVDCWPTGVGTPPCAGGGLRTRDRDGTYLDTFNVDNPPEDDMTPAPEFVGALYDASIIRGETRAKTVDYWSTDWSQRSDDERQHFWTEVVSGLTASESVSSGTYNVTGQLTLE